MVAVLREMITAHYWCQAISMDTSSNSNRLDNTTVDSLHLFYELWSDVCAIPQVVRHGVPST
jgi:hypothetical protein